MSDAAPARGRAWWPVLAVLVLAPVVFLLVAFWPAAALPDPDELVHDLRAEWGERQPQGAALQALRDTIAEAYGPAVVPVTIADPAMDLERWRAGLRDPARDWQHPAIAWLSFGGNEDGTGYTFLLHKADLEQLVQLTPVTLPAQPVGAGGHD